MNQNRSRLLGIVLIILSIIPSSAITILRFNEGEVNDLWNAHAYGVLLEALVDEVGEKHLIDYLHGVYLDYSTNHDMYRLRRQLKLRTKVSKDSLCFYDISSDADSVTEHKNYLIPLTRDSTLLRRLNRRINDRVDTLYFASDLWYNIPDSCSYYYSVYPMQYLNTFRLPDTCYVNNKIKEECWKDSTLMFSALNRMLEKFKGIKVTVYKKE